MAFPRTGGQFSPTASLVAQMVEPACSVRVPGSIPQSGRSPGEGSGTPPQYSYLKNPMNRGTWKATVHGVALSHKRRSHRHFQFPPTEAHLQGQRKLGGAEIYSGDIKNSQQ